MSFDPAAIAAHFSLKHAFITVGAGVVVPLAVQNPNRVAISFGVASGTMNISPFNNPSASVGIAVSSSVGLLVISFADHPQLVSLPWFVFSTGGGTIYVAEEIAITTEDT